MKWVSHKIHICRGYYSARGSYTILITLLVIVCALEELKRQNILPNYAKRATSLLVFVPHSYRIRTVYVPYSYRTSVPYSYRGMSQR